MGLLEKVADFFIPFLRQSFPAVGSPECVLNTLEMGSEAERVPRYKSVSQLWSGRGYQETQGPSQVRVWHPKCPGTVWVVLL